MIDDIAASGHGVLWCTSGTLLVWSIWSIRKFLRSRNDNGESINIETLWLHATAFGVFAVAMLINEVAIVFYAVVDEQTKNSLKDFAQDMFLLTSIITSICAFISQCLLSVIFLRLCNEPVDDEVEIEDTDTTI
jgi:hypothetical protein